MSDITAPSPTAPDGDAEMMADRAGHGAHDDEHSPGQDHHGPTDRQFITLFFILAVVTALEVAASYVELGPFFLPVLLFLMVVKFASVVLYFMHVKFDNKIFGRLFYVGLFLAVAVYAAALTMFHFFTS